VEGTVQAYYVIAVPKVVENDFLCVHLMASFLQLNQFLINNFQSEAALAATYTPNSCGPRDSQMALARVLRGFVLKGSK